MYFPALTPSNFSSSLCSTYCKGATKKTRVSDVGDGGAAILGGLLHVSTLFFLGEGHGGEAGAMQGLTTYLAGEVNLNGFNANVLGTRSHVVKESRKSLGEGEVKTVRRCEDNRRVEGRFCLEHEGRKVSTDNYYVWSAPAKLNPHASSRLTLTTVDPLAQLGPSWTRLDSCSAIIFTALFLNGQQNQDTS